MEIIRSTFARQALPMTWDFAEANLFGSSSGSFEILLAAVAKALERLPASLSADVRQLDATATVRPSHDALVCTDPPYYDNIGYADLSDYFYVWLRRALKDVHPDLFSTLLTPNARSSSPLPTGTAAAVRRSGSSRRGCSGRLSGCARRSTPTTR